MKHGEAIRLQNEIAEKVVARDDFDRIERVSGVDVAYDGDTVYCSTVVMEKNKVVESAGTKTRVTHHYIPGLLMLREAEPILQTVRTLKSEYDLLLVDGYGHLHPRKCGLACYVGVTLDKPAIGVAKSRLCGTVRPDGFIELGGKVLGCLLGKLYVSVGHKVSLKTAVEIAKLGTEPLRLADIYSKAQKRGKGRLAQALPITGRSSAFSSSGSASGSFTLALCLCS